MLSQRKGDIFCFTAEREDNKRLYAVQLEMMMRVIAKTNHFTDEELEDMRREAVNNVRRTRGKIKLEDIAKGWYNEE